MSRQPRVCRARVCSFVLKTFRLLSQRKQLANPDAVIGVETRKDHPLLSEYGKCYQGLATSDNAQFVMSFWEVKDLNAGWHLFQFAPSEPTAVAGCSNIIFWEDGQGRYYRHAMGLKEIGRLGGWRSGHEAWSRSGVAINRMGRLPATPYRGEKFDCNVAVFVPEDPQIATAVWLYCCTQEYHDAVRALNKKLSVTNATLAKVPFDVERWMNEAAERYPDGSPAPYSEDPTQWLFKGTVTPFDAPLQVAVAKLLGYRWPEQAKDAVDPFIDDDGIVCLPAVRGEPPAVDRVRQVLAVAYGKGWSPAKEAALLKELGYEGKSLEEWLRDGFFEQHCQLFHQRPFIWHIWDGRKKDGFSALVNYHRLDRKRLETLAYTYLGDWISRQEDGVKKGEGGAEGKLTAAHALQEKLELILEGESPYDIFVRWKPLEEQPIGWEPDLTMGCG